MPSVGRVYPSLANCAPPPPVLPARLPALPERQTAPQHAFPRKPAKIRRATQQRLCPTGANSVVPAPPQRPLPGRARQRRPTRAVPARHPSSTSAASARPALPSTPTSPPPNHRRRQAPARGLAAVCALHRPTRNAKKRPCPLLVGHGRVDPGPKALAAGTAGLRWYVACALHQLEDDHLGAVAATGTLLDDAGVAAALTLFRGALLGMRPPTGFSC